LRCAAASAEALPRPFEPDVDPLLRRILAARTGAFLDVGATMGQYFLKQRGLGHGGPYLGVEATPELAAYLQDLPDLNTRPGEPGQVSACGLGDQVRVADLSVTAAFGSGSSLIAGFRPDDFYMAQRCVPVLPGDRVVSDLDLGPIAPIEIDVEGGELDVCRGLARTSEAEGPPLLLEVLPPDGLGRSEPILDRIHASAGNARVIGPDPRPQSAARAGDRRGRRRAAD
jgi:FkbM family methyltransferase